MSKRLAIGVDLGGTNLRVALVDEGGSVVKKTTEPSAGDVVSSLRRAVRGLATPEVRGVGIGVAGLVDREAGRVITSPNLPVLKGQRLGDVGLDIPTYVINDADAAANAEGWLGAGRDLKCFVLLTLGTGIGGAIVSGGKLLKAPAEFGHMSVRSEGRLCPCGNRDCLELYASARAVTEAAVRLVEGGAETLLGEGNVYSVTPEDVYRAALEGDIPAREILKEAGRYLGAGIVNVINIMAPEAVIISGGLTGVWDIMVSEAIAEASKRTLKGLFDKVRIVPAALGEEAGQVGAAGYALGIGRIESE